MRIAVGVVLSIVCVIAVFYMGSWFAVLSGPAAMGDDALAHRVRAPADSSFVTKLQQRADNLEATQQELVKQVQEMKQKIQQFGTTRTAAAAVKAGDPPFSAEKLTLTAKTGPALSDDDAILFFDSFYAQKVPRFDGKSAFVMMAIHYKAWQYTDGKRFYHRDGNGLPCEPHGHFGRFCDPSKPGKFNKTRLVDTLKDPNTMDLECRWSGGASSRAVIVKDSHHDYNCVDMVHKILCKEPDSAPKQNFVNIELTTFGASIARFSSTVVRPPKKDYLVMCTPPITPHYFEYDVQEWIEWHLMIGVDHVYTFEQEQGLRPGLKLMLQKYAERGVLTRHVFNLAGIDPPDQYKHGMFDECLWRYRENAQWLFYVDVDEFFVPMKGRTLPQVLKQYESVETSAVFAESWRYLVDSASSENDLLTKAHNQREDWGQDVAGPGNGTPKSKVWKKGIWKPEQIEAACYHTVSWSRETEPQKEPVFAPLEELQLHHFYNIHGARLSRNCPSCPELMQNKSALITDEYRYKEFGAKLERRLAENGLKRERCVSNQACSDKQFQEQFYKIEHAKYLKSVQKN